MKSRFVTWKGVEIFVKADGAAYILGRSEKTVFPSLRAAFNYINYTAGQPKSLWDTIKKAVRDYKLKDTVFSRTYLGDDDRGIYNEMRLEGYFDGVYDFLRECKCLHLVFPRYYNSKDEEVAA